MRRSGRAWMSALGVTAILVLGGCSAGTTEAEPPVPASTPATSASTTPSQESADSETAQVSAPGSFVPYSDYVNDTGAYEDSEVVLFFNASWCPTCNEAVKSIESTGVPQGVAIVSVDFDSSQDLKQKYGVTQQHTYVQIDSNGKEVQKFSGNITAQSVADELA
jgi:thioredoxin 1